MEGEVYQERIQCSARKVFIPSNTFAVVEEGRFYLKPRWWKKVRRAFEDLKEETNNFTTKKNIDIEDVQTDRYKLIALRLISGWSREHAAQYIGSPLQSLVKWESGKARTVLPPNTAEKIVLASDFGWFRRQGGANTFITRFFQECSLSDMKRDSVVKRRLDVAMKIAVALVVLSFVLVFLGGALLGSTAFSATYGIIGSASFLIFVMIFMMVFVGINPLIGGSIGVDLVYANRFLLGAKKAGRKWAKKLLIDVASMIRYKAQSMRKSSIDELEDIAGLYERVADSVESRLISQVDVFETLSSKEKSAFAFYVRRLAEHFFSPTLDSVISLRDVSFELAKGIPERSEEKKRVQEFIKWLDKGYETPTGRLIVDAARIPCFAWWFTAPFYVLIMGDVQTTLQIFGVFILLFVTLKATQSRGK